jgi:hypothetical protein
MNQSSKNIMYNKLSTTLKQMYVKTISDSTKPYKYYKVSVITSKLNYINLLEDKNNEIIDIRKYKIRAYTNIDVLYKLYTLLGNKVFSIYEVNEDNINYETITDTELKTLIEELIDIWFNNDTMWIEQIDHDIIVI